VQASTEFIRDEVLEPAGYFDVSADAGGPYEVTEGSTVTLDPSGSTGDGLSFAWDPADEIAGVDDGTQSVTLTVTNEHGISDTDTAEVTTVNAPPVISALSVTTTPPAQTVSVQAAFTDPGTADTHTVVADWGDGTSGPIAGGHTYADAGRYTVKVTVTDDDGGSASASKTVVVGCTVVGTDRNDMLIGTKGDDVICGFGGNDFIAGLDGNDRLYGGTGHDLLLGGRGNDLLVGGPGFDWAIGNQGTNTCTAELRHSCTIRN
jgi:Ca2+-binding RTX toxin-like protein